jgi:hypothetical protein
MWRDGWLNVRRDGWLSKSRDGWLNVEGWLFKSIAHLFVTASFLGSNPDIPQKS